MDVARQQARIDAIPWYHEFDFGNGLKARSNYSDVEVAYHRKNWQFIEAQLDTVDFQGKSVLDIGCWDGYWSFYAERRGARSVLATDDRSQNWSDGQGIHLARELLGSKVQINQDMSVYQVASLNQKFDIVLFLGVYYHLHDPLYAFTQLRHCCHRDSVVLIDGPEALALLPGSALYDFTDATCEFLPTWEALQEILRATYFSPVSRATLNFDSGESEMEEPEAQPPGRLGWRWRLRMCAQVLKGSRPDIHALTRQVFPPPPEPVPPPRKSHRRMFVRCVPLEDVNKVYCYRPSFGLDQYDRRYRDHARV